MSNVRVGIAFENDEQYPKSKCELQRLKRLVSKCLVQADTSLMIQICKRYELYS